MFSSGGLTGERSLSKVPPGVGIHSLVIDCKAEVPVALLAVGSLQLKAAAPVLSLSSL